MIPINDTQLAQICAEEATKPDFPTKEYQEAGKQIATAINSTALAIFYGIKLYTDTKGYLEDLFSGTRAIPANQAVARAGNRYMGTE